MKKIKELKQKIIATIALACMLSMYMPTINYAVMELNITDTDQNITSQNQNVNLAEPTSRTDENKTDNSNETKNDYYIENEKDTQTDNNNGQLDSEHNTHENSNSNNNMILINAHSKSTTKKVGDTVNKDDPIPFNDNAFKKVLLDQGVDTNSDNEISINEMEQVEFLWFSNEQPDKVVSNMDEIRYAQNLKTFGFWGESNMTSFDCLKDNTNLEQLGINSFYDGLQDLNFISNLTNLRELTLNVYNCNIQDTSFLNQLTKLEQLEISTQGINSTDIINNINSEQIRRLTIDTSYEDDSQDLSNISKLTTLQELNLENQNIKDASIFSNLSNLEILNIARNDIVDASPLKNLKKLEVLNIQKNNNLNTDSLADLNIPTIWCGRDIQIEGLQVNKGETCEIDLPEFLANANNPNCIYYTSNYDLHVDWGDIDAHLNNDKTKIIINADNLNVGELYCGLSICNIVSDKNCNIDNTSIQLHITVKENVSEKYKIEFEDATLENYMKERYDDDGDGVITNYDMLQIRELNLNYYNGIDVTSNCYSLKGIENARNATSVYMNTYNNIDLTPLFEMNNVINLYIGGNNFNISKITEMDNLESLSISTSGQQFNVDLSPITYLTNLKYFQINDYSFSYVFDCNILNNKPNLKHMELRSNLINTDKLAQHKNLWQLQIQTNGKLDDISFVSEMDNLSYLNLSNNKITDITPLVSLEKLYWVDLTSNPIDPNETRNANALGELEAKRVSVLIDEYDNSEIIEFKDSNFKQFLINNGYDSNNDSNISKKEMESYSRIEINSYSGIKFTSIDEIEYATNLEELTILWYDGSTNLDINCISKLTKLRDLNISGSELEGLNNSAIFKDLAKLERLQYSVSNQPLDISKLHNCIILKELEVDTMGSRLENAEQLSNLPELESLSISQYNDFDANIIVNNLNKDKIKRLILRGSVQNADAVWQLENVEILELDGENGSKKTDFSGITNLKKLKELTLSGFEFLTAIDNIEKIIELENLEKLNLNLGYAVSYNDNLNEQRLIDVIENSKCEQVSLNGDYTIDFKGIECDTTREVRFDELGPIMRAVLNPESKLYNPNVSFSNQYSYYNGYSNIEVDNENKKVIINADSEIARKTAEINPNMEYGINGFRGSIRLTWTNIKLEDNPTEINIPDINLKNALLDNYDLDGDEKITTNDMNNLTELTLVKYDIEDLTGLEKAENLKKINLSNNNIINVEPLSNLNKLEDLLLQNNRISDLKPIKDILKRGGWIILSDNYITDLTGLEDVNFDEIDLGYNYLDVSENTENYRIIESSARNHYTKYVQEHPEYFEENVNVENIIQSSLMHITGWYQRSKYGTPNEREEIVELEENVKQKLIEVGYDINDDGNLSKGELSDFDRIRNIDLSNLEISNIDGLKYLCKVQELNISNNNITDISPLKYCKSLETLDLSYNKINNIEAVEDYFNVTNLNLSNNSIKDIDSLGNIRTAEIVFGYDGYFAGEAAPYRSLEIDLSNNKIINISAINKLTTLSTINLSDNKISDISTLADYDFNKIFGNIDESELHWFENQPVTVDLSNNMIKVDSDGTQNAIKHFEDYESTIKLDNQTELTFGLGDVNADGKINVIDCTAILKHIKGTKLLTDDEKTRADVNKDNKVNVIDCTAILKHIKGTKLIEE